MGILEEVNAGVVAILATLFGVIATIIQLIVKVVDVKFRVWEELQMKKVDIKKRMLEFENIEFVEHPFWSNLYAYINNKLTEKTAPNEFKRQCAVEFIKVSWVLYEKFLREDLLPIIKDNATESQIIQKFVEGSEKTKTLRRLELKKIGMDDRIIAVLERQRHIKIEMKHELYKTVLHSKAYSTIQQKIWAILDLQNYLLEQMSSDTWDSISNANGELYGLSFNGHNNEKP
jgi:hypothetical protein